jgi:hypothetical protein
MFSLKSDRETYAPNGIHIYPKTGHRLSEPSITERMNVNKRHMLHWKVYSILSVVRPELHPYV